MNYSQISITADLIGILALAILFISTFKTECFKLSEWYTTILPIFISYLAQFIALIVEKAKEE